MCVGCESKIIISSTRRCRIKVARGISGRRARQRFREAGAKLRDQKTTRPQARSRMRLVVLPRSTLAVQDTDEPRNAGRVCAHVSPLHRATQLHREGRHKRHRARRHEQGQDRSTE